MYGRQRVPSRIRSFTIRNPRTLSRSTRVDHADRSRPRGGGRRGASRRAARQPSAPCPQHDHLRDRDLVDAAGLASLHNETPPGKLADAELHFADGCPLDGLKLIGFSVWERRSGGGRNVTFPARQYAVNGERRSFALLRPILDSRRAGSHSRPGAAGLRRESDQ